MCCGCKAGLMVSLCLLSSHFGVSCPTRRLHHLVLFPLLRCCRLLLVRNIIHASTSVRRRSNTIFLEILMFQLLHGLQILLIQIIKPDFVPHIYLLFVDQFAPVEGLRIGQFLDLELVVYMLTDVPLVLFSFQIVLRARNWYHYCQRLA